MSCKRCAGAGVTTIKRDILKYEWQTVVEEITCPVCGGTGIDFDKLKHQKYLNNINKGPAFRCELCDKPLTKSQRQRHHLKPKSLNKNLSFGKFAKIDICQECHVKIHKRVPLKELNELYTNVEQLKEILSW